MSQDTIVIMASRVTDGMDIFESLSHGLIRMTIAQILQEGTGFGIHQNFLFYFMNTVE